ncbi:MAG: T9SS type A sorting domain-containing protein, partial [Hymenobacter sp.]
TVGLNRYRLLGQNVAGRIFVSDTVDVQLVRRGELLVFPVPVVIGQNLQVAGEPGVPLELSLYDALGRLTRTSLLSGSLNLFDTSGLRPGVYLLRATPATGGGPARTRRVVLVN